MAGKDLRDAGEAWSELQELLRAAASAGPQPREMAARYTQLRDRLLKTHYAAVLPGFMHQCLTLDRFRDFIYLYHPRAEARLDFLAQAFEPVEPTPTRFRRRDFFAEAGDF